MQPRPVDVAAVVRPANEEAQRLLGEAQRLLASESAGGSTEAASLIFEARWWLSTVESALDLDGGGRAGAA